MKTLFNFLTVVLLGTVLHGQTTVDSSGSSLLKGAYRFRQVAILNVDANRNPTEMEAVYGVITFDGKSSYSLTGAYVDNTVSQGALLPLTRTSGTYAIGASGLGYITSPLFPGTNLIYGAVAQSVFMGSDTEDGNVNDIFIAIPVGTPVTNVGFNAAYSVGLLDFTGASNAALKNALFNLTANGRNSFAAISLTGQAVNQNGASISQTVTGATYNFATDGSATINIPLPSGVSAGNALFTGAKSMVVSGDGNFVLGWTASGYDIFFGVSILAAPATNASYQGTYYLAALEDAPTVGNGPDSYYGSLLAAHGDGNQIVHERLEYFGYYAEDLVTDNATQLNANGTSATPDTNGYQYAFGDGGKAFVAIGTSGTYTLLVGLQAPFFSGLGVFLNPTGVFNAANYAPITASVAPGELLTLFGSGLAPVTLAVAGGQPFPTSLGGVQVLMNGQPAPIYYVSPSQISALVPYSLSPTSTQFLDTIQVNNGGMISNGVTMYLTDAVPGVFSENGSGIGYGAVLHAADSSAITANNPATAGEYIEIFLTGLGTVAPSVVDGALGPSGPLSSASLYNSNIIAVNFLDRGNSSFRPGKVTYAGLAPGLAGLYQLNVQVPSGVGPGDVYLEIVTDFADVHQVKIRVSVAPIALAQPQR